MPIHYSSRCAVTRTAPSLNFSHRTGSFYLFFSSNKWDLLKQNQGLVVFPSAFFPLSFFLHYIYISHTK